MASDTPQPTQHHPVFGPPRDEKYIVFKREEWDHVWQLAAPPGGINEVEDAVVIRRKDIFAASALHAYADAIQTTIEVMRESGHQAPEHLHYIYIYFKEQATAAEIAPDKGVPD